MIVLLLAIFSIFSYLINAILILKQFLNSTLPSPKFYFAWLAVIAHTFYIGLICQQNQGFNFGFLNMASFASLLVSLMLLIMSLSKSIDKLGLVIFPISALTLGVDVIFPNPVHELKIHSPAMSIHIFTSIIALGLLTIAFFQALFLEMREKHLKNHTIRHYIKLLPPLQTMELLLFQLLGVGVLLLTISLLTGFVFLENLFIQHLAHKTVLSILAWTIFSTVLLGRKFYGWRGKTAIRWTLTGFILLLLGYFGSKMVLEFILNYN